MQIATIMLSHQPLLLKRSDWRRGCSLILGIVLCLVDVMATSPHASILDKLEVNGDCYEEGATVEPADFFYLEEVLMYDDVIIITGVASPGAEIGVFEVCSRKSIEEVSDVHSVILEDRLLASSTEGSSQDKDSNIGSFVENERFKDSERCLARFEFSFLASDLGLSEGSLISCAAIRDNGDTSGFSAVVALMAPEICGDGLDNDGDGLIDCLDPDCFNFDFDGDGVCDNVDQDDDNDGLLDTEECTTLGPELIQNGDFEDGYAHWTSDFNRGKNNFAGTAGTCATQGWIAVSPCSSDNGECFEYYRYDGGTFDGSVLITDPLGTGANVLSTTICDQTNWNCRAELLPDHTTGSGNSLYVDPNDIVGEAYVRQDVSIVPNTFYEFSAWIMVIEEDPNLQFRINGQDLTAPINLDRLTPGTDGPDLWQRVSSSWFSGSASGTVSLALVNLTSGCSGNDIRLDDVSFRQINIDDQDGDGIADCYDRDTDGDGCSDVIEALFSDPDADGVLGTSPVTVDANGLVTSGIDGYTGTNSAVIDPSSQSGCADNDLDGVADFNDLDDDNDGILDSVENPDVFTSLSLGPWTPVAGADSNDVLVGDVFVMPNVLSYNGDLVDLRFELTGTFSRDGVFGGTVVLDNAMGGLFLNNVNPLDIEYISYSISFVLNNSVTTLDPVGVPVMMRAIEFHLHEIDNDGALNSWTEIKGYRNPDVELISAGAQLGTYILDNGDAVFGLDPIVADDAGFNDPDHLVVAKRQMTDGIDLIMGVGGTFNGIVSGVGGGLTARAILLIDTDDDGTPDMHDLDSDDDGCSDVTEAGFADENADGYLGDAPLSVDVDGLVISAVGGYTGTNYEVTDATLYGGCADNDNDGITDYIDIDDDNDGILDSDECQGVMVVDGAHTLVSRSATSLNTTTADGLSYQVVTEPGITLNTATSHANLTLASGSSIPQFNGPQTWVRAEVNTDKDIDDHGTLTITFPSAVTDPIISITGLANSLYSPRWSVSLELLNQGVTMSLIESDPDFSLDGQTIRAGQTPSHNGDGKVAINGIVDQLTFRIRHRSATNEDGRVRFEVNLAYTTCDTDGDGQANFFDLDSDNDGVYDVLEAGGVDADLDGVIGTGTITDVNGNGWSDIVDNTAAGTVLIDPDTDLDGAFDRLDPDSDNDGCLDVVESGGADANGDGLLDGDGVDLFGRVTTAGVLADGYDGLSGEETIATRLTLATHSGYTIDVHNQTVLQNESVTFTFEEPDARRTFDFIGTAPATSPDYAGPTSSDLASGFNYQWYLGDPDSGGSLLVGETTTSLSLTPTLADDGNQYCITVTHDNSECFQYKSCGTLTVEPNLCDPVLSGLPDSDSDGVTDYCDQDDDNDGIPDDQEGFVTQVYSHTGSDQFFTVPTGVTQIEVKVWGAGGGGGINIPGGTGGFVSGRLAVIPGQQFVVVAGSTGTGHTDAPAPDKYGFAGSKSLNNSGAEGGGLSGVFTGSSAVTDTDGSRAVFIAGGGGGGHFSTAGNGGDNVYGGGMPTMSGQDDLVHPGGSGGGGYEGGAAFSNRFSTTLTHGEGGANYLRADVIDPISLSSPDHYGTPVFLYPSPPRRTDHQYVELVGQGSNNHTQQGVGNGMVVINYSTGLDTDGDGVTDRLDLDSDNDGIYDAIESGCAQAHTDGVLDGGVNAEGTPLAVSDGSGGVNYALLDTDSDVVADYLDLDSDNDGCSDALEAGFTDDDGDGVLGSDPVTADANGLVTSGVDGYTGTTTFVTNSSLQSGCPDNDNDGISNENDLDNDNDGILDVNECYVAPIDSNPVVDGIEDNDYPRGYWDAQYYYGVFGIQGSSGYSDDRTGTNTSGTPVFLGEASFGVNEFGLTDSRTFTNLQTPTSAAVRPSSYNGVSLDPANGQTYYTIHFNRKMHLSGVLEFGNTGFHVDDVLEVYINNVQYDFYGNCCGATTFFASHSIPFNSGDDVQLRYSNLGGTGGYRFNFKIVYCTGVYDFDNDGVQNGVDLDSDNDGIYDAIESGSMQAQTNGVLDGGVDAFGIPLSVSNGSGGVDYLTRDTDADTFADVFDLDSDSDLCSDVLEAGFTDGDGDGILGSDPLSVDVNGLVTSGVDGYTGTTTFVTNSSLQSGCLDNDNDGISDQNDIDDDNDGILDSDEGVVGCSASTNLNGVDFSEGTIGAQGTILSANVSVQGDLADEGIFDLNGTVEIVSMEPDGAFGVDFTGDTIMDFQNGIAPNGGDNVEVALSFDGIAMNAHITWGTGLFSTGEYYEVRFDPSITPVIVNPVANIVITQSPGVVGFSTVNSIPASLARDMVITLPKVMAYSIYREDNGPGARGGVTLTHEVYCDRDSDSDSVPDHFDLDSDNDGIHDVSEAGGADPDLDGRIGSGAITDTNNNGWSDIVDSTNGGTILPDTDTDTDTIPNRLDTDSDGDTCSDVIEAGFPDPDGDGQVGGLVPPTIDSNGRVTSGGL